MKADEDVDVCSNCKHILTDEDYITIFEDRGDMFIRKEIVIGYKCNVCGHIEGY